MFGSISELQDNYTKKEKGRKFVVMTATCDLPRILILLIQIEKDHLNNWQALLTILPLNSPWSGARSIQGGEGISVTITHLPLRALGAFVQPLLQGMGPD